MGKKKTGNNKIRKQKERRIKSIDFATRTSTQKLSSDYLQLYGFFMSGVILVAWFGILYGQLLAVRNSKIFADEGSEFLIGEENINGEYSDYIQPIIEFTSYGAWAGNAALAMFSTWNFFTAFLSRAYGMVFDPYERSERLLQNVGYYIGHIGGLLTVAIPSATTSAQVTDLAIPNDPASIKISHGGATSENESFVDWAVSSLYDKGESFIKKPTQRSLIIAMDIVDDQITEIIANDEEIFLKDFQAFVKGNSQTKFNIISKMAATVFEKAVLNDSISSLLQKETKTESNASFIGRGLFGLICAVGVAMSFWTAGDDISPELYKQFNEVYASLLEAYPKAWDQGTSIGINSVQAILTGLAFFPTLKRIWNLDFKASSKVEKAYMIISIATGLTITATNFFANIGQTLQTLASNNLFAKSFQFVGTSFNTIASTIVSTEGLFSYLGQRIDRMLWNNILNMNEGELKEYFDKNPQHQIKILQVLQTEFQESLAGLKAKLNSSDFYAIGEEWKTDFDKTNPIVTNETLGSKVVLADENQAPFQIEKSSPVNLDDKPSYSSLENKAQPILVTENKKSENPQTHWQFYKTLETHLQSTKKSGKIPSDKKGITDKLLEEGQGNIQDNTIKT